MVVGPVFISTFRGWFSFHHILTSTCCLVFFMTATLTGMRWQLTVVLTSISLTLDEVEHLFMCLLAICMSFLEKCLFSSSAIFLLFHFLCYWIDWTSMKNLPATQETWVRSSGWKDPLEKRMASLDNSTDRGAWWAIVHGVTKSQTQTSN